MLRNFLFFLSFFLFIGLAASSIPSMNPMKRNFATQKRSENKLLSIRGGGVIGPINSVVMSQISSVVTIGFAVEMFVTSRLALFKYLRDSQV